MSSKTKFKNALDSYIDEQVTLYAESKNVDRDKVDYVADEINLDEVEPNTPIRQNGRVWVKGHEEDTIEFFGRDFVHSGYDVLK